MDSCPNVGAERGGSGGGEVMEISLLSPDAVRLPPAGRACGLGLPVDVVELDGLAACLTGDSDGDSKALISMPEVGPSPAIWVRLLKSKNDGPY